MDPVSCTECYSNVGNQLSGNQLEVDSAAAPSALNTDPVSHAECHNSIGTQLSELVTTVKRPISQQQVILEEAIKREIMFIRAFSLAQLLSATAELYALVMDTLPELDDHLDQVWRMLTEWKARYVGADETVFNKGLLAARLGNSWALSVEQAYEKACGVPIVIDVPIFHKECEQPICEFFKRFKHCCKNLS